MLIRFVAKVPRARVSELMFPGNDFWLFDDEFLVFLVFAGNGLVVDRPAKTDPNLIARCRASFEAAWALPSRTTSTRLL